MVTHRDTVRTPFGAVNPSAVGDPLYPPRQTDAVKASSGAAKRKSFELCGARPEGERKSTPGSLKRQGKRSPPRCSLPLSLWTLSHSHFTGSPTFSLFTENERGKDARRREETQGDARAQLYTPGCSLRVCGVLHVRKEHPGGYVICVFASCLRADLKSGAARHRFQRSGRRHHHRKCFPGRNRYLPRRVFP